MEPALHNQLLAALRSFDTPMSRRNTIPGS